MYAKRRVNPNSLLAREFLLKESDYPKFYKSGVNLLKMQLGDASTLDRAGIPLYTKLSPGNQRPPLTTDHLYNRILGILRRLIENPCGIKTLRREYKVKRRGYRVKPPDTRWAGGAFLRRVTRLLRDNGLLDHHDRGYYTSIKGKALLLKAKAAIDCD